LNATPAEILKKVRRIEVTTRRLVDDVFGGQYHSTFRGRGMEFSEVREYLPGDDVRSIDWNVTARAGKPFVKKFIEERELTVMLLVDTSASQRFGTRGQLKSDLTAEIAALVALSALRNKDKVGMIFFSRDVEQYIPPRKSRGHALRLIREVLAAEPKGAGTSIQKALDYLNRVQRRRAVVFLISDFLDAGYEKTLRTTQKRHDVISVVTRDPWESRWPRGVPMLIEDAESGHPSFYRLPAARAAAVDALQKTERERLASLFRRSSVDAINLETGLPYMTAFLQFFKDRARRFR
jgi:uncharacterized protein (DUF58 family)